MIIHIYAPSPPALPQKGEFHPSLQPSLHMPVMALHDEFPLQKALHTCEQLIPNSPMEQAIEKNYIFEIFFHFSTINHMHVHEYFFVFILLPTLNDFKSTYDRCIDLLCIRVSIL